jgi:hypothetical protein
MILRKTDFVFLVLMFAVSCEEPQRRNMLYSEYAPATTTSVKVHSKIIETEENFEIWVVGVCWSNSPSPTANDNKIIGNASLSDGRFELELPELDRRKQYHVRAFITNRSGEIFYGNELTFINDFLPELTGSRIAEYQENALRIRTGLGSSGSLPIIEIGHVWSKDPLPTIDDSKAEVSSVPSGGGEFESELTNLEKETVYYVRPYAISGEVVTYGKQIIAVVPDEVIKGKWAYVPMADLPHYFKHTLAIDDDLYFFGSFHRYVLDPDNYEPSSTKQVFSMPYERVGDPQAEPIYVDNTPFADASHAFASGGSAYFYTTGWAYMQEYNISEKQWIQRPKLGGNVQFMTSDGDNGYAAVIRNGNVGTFYRYTIATNKWTVMKSHTFTESVLHKPLLIGNILYFVSGDNLFYSLNLETNEVKSYGAFPAKPSLIFEYSGIPYVISGNEVFHYVESNASWEKNSRAPIEPLVSPDEFELFGIVPTFLRLRGETYIVVFYPEYFWDTEYEFSNLMIKYSE